MNPSPFDAIAESCMAVFREQVGSLERIPFIDAVRRAEGLAGVYLVYDRAGELLYAGSAMCVGSRLVEQAKDGPLFRALARARGVAVDDVRRHVCACGTPIPCPTGPVRQGPDPEALEGLSGEIRTSLSVALIPMGPEKQPTRRQFERFLQWVLEPRFGVEWPLQPSARAK